MRPRSVASLPDSTASTGLLCLLVGAHVHCGRSITEVSMWLLLHTFHLQCMTILGIPGWVPTDDTQPKAWAKARLSCDPSHQVWTENLREREYTLVPESFPPGSLHACTGWCSTCDSTSRSEGWIGIIISSHCALP